MGLRSPQELQQVQAKPEGTQRFQGAVAPKIDTTFIDEIDKNLTAQENARARAKREQLKFITKDYSNKLERMRIDAQGTLAETHGQASIDMYDAQAKKIDKDFSTAMKSYPEEYHPYLEQHAETIKNKYHTFGTPYVAGQANKMSIDTAKVFQGNQANWAIEKSNDDEFFATEGLAAVGNAAKDVAQKQYGNNPYMVKSFVEQSMSDTTQKAIAMQANTGNLPRAKQMYEKYKDVMNPEHEQDALAAIQKAETTSDNLDAANAVKEAMALHKNNPGLQAKFLYEYAKENNKSSKVLAQMESLHRYELDIQSKQEAARIMEVKDKLYKDPTNPALKSQLPADEQAKHDKFLERTQGTGVRSTNEETYRKVSDILNNANTVSDLPMGFRVDAFAGEITKERLDPLRAQFNALMNSAKDEKAKVRLSTGKMIPDIVAAVSIRNGLYSPQQKGELEHLLRMKHNELTAGGNIPDYATLQKELYKVAAEKGVIKVKTGSRNYNPLSSKYKMFEEKTKPVANPDLAVAPKPSLTAADPSWVKEISRRRPGLTAKDINDYIEKKRAQGIDVTKPYK